MENVNAEAIGAILCRRLPYHLKYVEFLVNSMQFGLGKQVNSSVDRFETGSGFGKHCGIISKHADCG